MPTAQLSENAALSDEIRTTIENLTRQIVADQQSVDDAGNRGVGYGSRDVGTDVTMPPAGEAQRFFGLAAIAGALLTNVVLPKVVSFIRKRTREVGAPEPTAADTDRDLAGMFSSLFPIVLNAYASPGGSAQDNRDLAPEVQVIVAGTADRGWFTSAFTNCFKVAVPFVMKLVSQRNLERGIAADDAQALQRGFEELLGDLVPLLLEAVSSIDPTIAPSTGGGRDIGPDLTAPGSPPATVPVPESADRGWGWFKKALQVAVPLAVKLITGRNIERGLPADDAATIERDLGDVLSTLVSALMSAQPDTATQPPTPAPASGNGSGGW